MGDFSQLPEDIIHCILSYFETDEAARPSMFCKAWYNAWLTCPTLNFQKPLRSKPKFFQFTERILQRYQDHKIPIERFKLYSCVPDSSSASHVSQWIRIAVQNGVKRLNLEFIDSEQLLYTLPGVIYEAKLLTKLSISGMARLSLNYDKVMFKYLQKLHLSDIYIDDDTFKGIIANCPLIENLTVSDCELLTKIKVTNLNNLKEFTINAWSNQAVEIGAPNLQYLDCKLEDEASLKLYKLEKLKYFEFDGLLPSSTFFNNFEDKFPQVEDLSLTSLISHTRINISSHALKHVMLRSTNKLIEVNFDAPNMVSLELDDIIVFPNLSIASAPSQLMLKISTLWRLETNEFSKLKQLLANVIRSKISIDLSLPYCECEFVDLKMIPIDPVVEIEDLQLSCSFSTSRELSKFLDALFLTCHPKAITVGSSPNLAVLLYENLIKRRKQELKKMKLEVYDVTKHQWIYRKSLVKTQHRWQRFCFRLEWKATLA